MAEEDPIPPLDCGLTFDDFQTLRNTTPLVRLNVDEGRVVFDKLFAMGFQVVAVE